MPLPRPPNPLRLLLQVEPLLRKRSFKASSRAKAKPEIKQSRPAEKQGLTFTERHRLETLPAEIEKLEAEIAKLEEYLSAPDLYQQAPLKFQKASAALVERQTALQSAEDEWLRLEEKNAS